MTIRPATLQDLPAIRRIQGASPTAPQWADADLQTAVLPDSAAGLQRRTLVAEVEGEVVGYAVLAVLVAVTPAEAELESIAVAPDHRRKGIGRVLLREILGHAAEAGAEAVRLEVRAGNAAAIGAYLSTGFQRTGTRKSYYRSPADDAVCMERSIPQKIGEDLPHRVA